MWHHDGEHVAVRTEISQRFMKCALINIAAPTKSRNIIDLPHEAYIQVTMWPFSDDEVVINNEVSTHEVVSYAIDGAFLIAVIIIVILWRWRKQGTRLRQLEMSDRRRQLNDV